jgi:poly(3-hydroxybutyrate) depolymerase
MESEQRILEATASLAFIVQQYVLDEQRVYIAGMSGGAQIASIVATLHPDLFNGGLFFCGVNPWSERDVDPWLENPPDDFSSMKENRYVFVSGTEDFKLAATARVYRIYKKAGIEDSKLIVVDGMGHEVPDAKTLDRALDFLDRDLTVRKQGEKSTRQLPHVRN